MGVDTVRKVMIASLEEAAEPVASVDATTTLGKAEIIATEVATEIAAGVTTEVTAEVTTDCSNVH
jgi:hypothetical protein